MRKTWPYLLGLALVAGAAVVIVLAAVRSKNSGTAGRQDVTAATAAAPKKACRIFTLADAKLILGGGAKGGPGVVPPSSGDLDVSYCVYTQDSGSNAPTSAAETASLRARAPKSAAAAAGNRGQFGRFRPAGVQDVKGYGNSAYWDSQNGQLNILKNNVWYTLAAGPPAPAGRSLDQARQLADLLIKKM